MKKLFDKVVRKHRNEHQKRRNLLLISAALTSLIGCGYIVHQLRSGLSQEHDEGLAFSAQLNSTYAGTLKKYDVSEIAFDRDAVAIQAGDRLICLLDVDTWFGGNGGYKDAAWTKPAGCDESRFVAMRKPMQQEFVPTILTATGESIVAGTGETIMAATKAGVRFYVKRSPNGTWRTVSYSVLNWGESAERVDLARAVVNDVEGVLARSSNHTGAL